MNSPTPLILSEQPLTVPTLLDLPDGVTTVMKHWPAVTLAELPALFDAGYTELAAAAPIGPGFAVYTGDVSATFDLHIGFPVAMIPDGFIGSDFPSGPALAVSHLGGYDGLSATWQHLTGDFAGRQLGPPRQLVEIYVTDPSVTAAGDLRTDLLICY